MLNNHIKIALSKQNTYGGCGMFDCGENNLCSKWCTKCTGKDKPDKNWTFNKTCHICKKISKNVYKLTMHMASVHDAELDEAFNNIVLKCEASKECQFLASCEFVLRSHERAELVMTTKPNNQPIITVTYAIHPFQVY